MRILTRDALRRSSAALAVLMMLAAMPGAFPMFTAALAMMDADHRVELGVAGEKSTVVLHHDTGCKAQAPQHRHCPLSRALVFFSESTSGNPDHVLHFAAGGKFLRNLPIVVPTPESPVIEPPLIPLKLVASATVPRRVCFPDSPAPPGALQSTSTTLLLI